jgi:hypothetical protein
MDENVIEELGPIDYLVVELFGVPRWSRSGPSRVGCRIRCALASLLDRVAVHERDTSPWRR